jgi:hypothetical protein
MKTRFHVLEAVINYHQRAWKYSTNLLEPAGRHFMGPIVNLRTERKRAQRRQAEQEAAANRLAHGISKKDQNLIKAQRDKDTSGFDQHRIERGEGQ